MDNIFIEISGSQLKNNFKNLGSLLGSQTFFYAVVKANAYGHGCQQVYEILKNLPEGYAVHSLDEAYYLSDLGCERPILIMGYIPLEHLDEAIEKGYHFVLYNKETLEQVIRISNRTGKKPYYHLKIETGTGRQGISQSEIKWYIDKIIANKNIKPFGIATHFANIEDTINHQYAMDQLATFNKNVNQFNEAGIEFKQIHTSCSAAVLLFNEAHFNAVRVGISLYGFWPSRETYLSFIERNRTKPKNFLEPVLTWKTRISQIKEMKKGSFIGYGLTYKTTSDSRIAVLPVGYSDGLDRGLSNNGYVLIRGERAPVRGRICMNVTMVDVTHIPEAAIEDEVTIIGSQNTEIITADYMASLLNTINYEVISRLNPLIPRYIVA